MQKTLAEIIHELTLKWAEENDIQETDEGLTPAQSKWKNFFSKHHHAYDNQFMVDLVAELTETDLSFMSNDQYQSVNFVLGVAIVPKANHNAHSYKNGRVIICAKPSSSIFSKEDGRFGNHMSTYVKDFRIAKLEEIEAFLKKNKKAEKFFSTRLEKNEEAV